MMNRHYPLYPVNHFDTFYDMLKGMKEQYRDRDAIVTYTDKGERQAFSFEQLYSDAMAFATALRAMGLNGTTVAIAGGNSYRYVVALFGVVLSGGIAVTMDVEHVSDEFLKLAARVGVEVIACDAELADYFLSCDNSQLKRLIILEGDKAQGTLCFDDLVEAGRMRAKMQAYVGNDEGEADRGALIVFTSGTTSVQKPVVLSQRNLLSNACGAAQMVLVGERVFTPLPLYHTYGLTCGVLGHISQGRTVGLCYSLKTMVRDMAMFDPQTITAVPLVAEMLYMRVRAVLRKMDVMEEAEAYFAAYHTKKRMPMPESVRVARQQAFGASLERMSCGGAHISAKVLTDMDALGVQILEGYGITECGPMVSCNRNEAQRFGSVGLPLPDTEIAFEDGEILVRGKGVSLGYYQDEALTNDAFRGEWFYTGDLGYQDGDGFLFITGRKKNLIVFKNGKKVAPEEIEEMVADIPLIKEAIAFGSNAGASSDDVQLALLIYPDPEKTNGMTSYEVMHALENEVNKVNKRLPAYKQVQTIKLRDIPFERTAAKKIKRTIQ